MENPVSTIKSTLNANFIIKMIMGFILVNALLELTKLDSWVYSPIQSIKGLMGK